MATIERRSRRAPIPAATTLAAADDLNGAGTTLSVTGSDRVIIAQINNGTAGTTGVDVIEVSHDGGSTWAADNLLLAIASDDDEGTLVANAALNAAGVEPSGAALFKTGPFEGDTLIRCGRGGTGEGGTAWTTGAPQVVAVVVNKQP